MRRPVQMSLIAVVVVLAAATAVLFLRYRQANADYKRMQVAEETSRARYDRTIEAIVEIQDSLNAISVAGEDVQMVSDNLRSEQSLSETESRQALDRIAMLRASIQRSTARIRQLESSLSKSGIQVAGLQRMIRNLKTSVADKEQQVAQLSGEVQQLSSKVTGLETTVQEQQATLVERDQNLEQKRRELATVFVAVGNKRQLQDAGVVVARGGVLGLGKTLLPSEAASERAFVPVDTDQETVVRTQAAKARVLSPQPASSYELREVNGVVELHILNAQEFRKVKQVVIVTA